MNSTMIPKKPIVIEYERNDELEHLPPYYFCNAPSCPCHVDEELTTMLAAMVDAREITPARALQIYWNMQP